MIGKIAELIKPPFHLFAPYPPARDREAWEKLPEELSVRLVREGEAHLKYSYPQLTAVDYMEFSRTGDREAYQTRLFQRRTALNALVLAECAEYHGRFLDDIINGVFCICGEAAWQLPAHNSYIRDSPQFPLPDVTRPIIDLFAAETGAVLSVLEYLLKEALDQVSPAVCRMIQDHVDRRIIKPYLTEHFWWMGDGDSQMNNWTVWCTQNVLLSAFTRPLPGDATEQIFHKACRSIDYFLAEYGEDGCCDEGAQYYRHAGLCLFNCLEILNHITGGAFEPVYGEKKIRNIAAYILNVHVDGIYYVNFADCSPVAGRCNAREFLFGKRTKNQDLMAFAASDYQHSEDPLLTEEHNLFYRLQTVFTHEEMAARDGNPRLPHRDIFHPSTGLFTARDSRLYLAVKAGDNDDSHNHNDTGSFTVYVNGRPLIIDVGVETYTKKTFSPRRYEIWTMQSQYHNLPTFFDRETAVMQEAGPQYRAEHVRYKLGEDVCRISMDLSRAYPDSRIRSYTREAVLAKGKHITVTDHYEGDLSPVLLSLMCFEKPKVRGNVISIGKLGVCEVTGCSNLRVESIPVTDSRLKTAWSHEVYRCLITMAENDLKLVIR